MKKIDVITENSDGLFNEFTMSVDEDGKLNMTDMDFGEKILSGEESNINKSGFIELDLGDGSKFGKVFISGITEKDEQFSDVEDFMLDVGSCLDNVLCDELSPEDEQDMDDYIENLTKDQ